MALKRDLIWAIYTGCKGAYTWDQDADDTLWLYCAAPMGHQYSNLPTRLHYAVYDACRPVNNTVPIIYGAVLWL